MKLRFKAAEVRRLIEHTRASPEHSALYDDRATAKPGLWLVGDSGVYLLSNGKPELRTEDGSKAAVAMSVDCDPDTMPFDAWWSAKGASFGGDDGCEFLAAETFDAALTTKGEHIALDVTPTSIGIFEPLRAVAGRVEPKPPKRA